MTATTCAPPTRRPPEWLAQLCLDHLAQEEGQARETLQSLLAVRAALLSHDQGALDEALTLHQGTVRRGEELRQQRDRFRQEIAHLLGIPAHEVTLSLLRAHLPEEASAAVAAAQARLQEQSAEVERLNRANAALMRSCLDFLQRFFGDLTGRPAEGRYGPGGVLRETPSGSLIDARG